jgi:flagellar motility protein MotE (MotC chaperone)
MSSGYKDYFDRAQKQKGLRKGAPSPVVRNNVRNKPTAPKARQKMNPLALMVAVVGFLVTLTGTYYLDEVEKFLSRIELGLFARAAAEVTEKPNPETATKAGANSTGQVSADNSSIEGGAVSPAKEAEDVELNHFARLRERKQELDRREEELNKMEAELALQRQEVEKKLQDLEQVRRKISSVLEDKVQADDQKVENLVQFYSNMKAPQAAKIIETIDEDLAVQVMAKMKKKTAADIMNLLKPEKAQAISEKYVGYRK